VPYYCEDLPADHEVNRLFLWYVAEANELGVIGGLPEAQDLVAAYRRLTPPREFEILEVTEPGSEPAVGSEFIGIDVSTALYFSLIGGSLLADVRASGMSRHDEAVFRLVDIIQLHFADRLNANGLFSSLQDAQLFLDSMLALQELRPNLFEAEGVEFACVALFAVPLQ